MQLQPENSFPTDRQTIPVQKELYERDTRLGESKLYIRSYNSSGKVFLLVIDAVRKNI